MALKGEDSEVCNATWKIYLFFTTAFALAVQIEIMIENSKIQ
jgi:hypothetical protein